MLLVRIVTVFFLCRQQYLCQAVETNEQDIISEDERNLRCCSQKLNCCDKPPEPTSFEVRALLQKCDEKHKTTAKAVGGTVIHARKRKNVDHEDVRCKTEDESIRKCVKKVKLTVKIKNVDFTNCKNQYILIDHVFDSATSKKQKLQNPYVLKIRQFPIMQTYGMNYESMVNLEAKEKIHSKHDRIYPGCNVDPSSPNPTCGVVKYKNEPIPYSTGFCCGCDQKNLIYGAENPLNSSALMEILGDASEKVTPKMIQKRGGQDCSDANTPTDSKLDSYHASTHCLEFSDIWYAVFRLNPPKIYHLLSIQIYEKNQDTENGCRWKDLTQRTPIYVGTEILHYTDEQNNIAINYYSAKKKESGFSLNYKTQKLLIPDTSNVDISKYPELCGGPAEYLVVNDHEVKANGKTCNVAGVGYEGFVKQPDRCNVPQGSCLKNQPKQMWMHDHEAQERGKKGSYFLKFFGLLPLVPIYVNASTQNKTLRMYFTDSYTSILDVEIKADENAILMPDALAVLTEVYIDSTHQRKTTITAKVFNSGLVSGVFMVSLSNCPMSIPASLGNINSRPVLIPPQRQHVFNLEIDCPLPINEFSCNLQVINAEQKVLAIRRIWIRKSDRCLCIWYCSCKCLIYDGRLKCQPLSLQEYHLAGFQGSMPVPMHVVQYSFVNDLISTMFLGLLIVCLVLLLMGLIKGIIGYFYVAIGEWGFDVLLGVTREFDHYHERPIHPAHRDRTRMMTYPAELCINLIFFIVYPFAVMWTMIKKMCFASRAKNQEEEFDKCFCKNGKLVQRKSSSFEDLGKRRSSDRENKEK